MLLLLWQRLATAQFRCFFERGRAIGCLLPLGNGRFMNLVVLYGDQGADVDAEQLALTEHSFDAALSELGVVARGQPCLRVADFNGEPTKIPCLSGGFSAWLWVGLQAAWAFARGSQPAVACKGTWGSPGGNRMDSMVGCPLAAAAVRSRMVDPGGWLTSHLAF